MSGYAQWLKWKTAYGLDVRGPFADTTALETAAPAASNRGGTALVGAASPYATYVSNGTAWVPQAVGTVRVWPAGTPVENMAEGDLVIVVA